MKLCELAVNPIEQGPVLAGIAMLLHRTGSSRVRWQNARPPTRTWKVPELPAL
jgi:hypothetical protein